MANNNKPQRSLFIHNGPAKGSTPGPNQRRRTIPMRPQGHPVEMQISSKGQLMAKYGPQVANAIRAKYPEVGFLVDAANTALPPGKRITFDNAQKIFSGLPAMKDTGTADVMNSSYGLSKAPNPKPVQLNSGIVPNAYANDYMSPSQNTCSPMYVTNVALGIPTSASNVINTYFTGTILFDIQTKAQSNVGFSLDTTSILTTANLLTAFNAGITALQVYYYYTSILSYESDTRNKNKGMIYLRSCITPQLLSDLTQLGRRLEDTPMPPRVVEWIRYMNMNFLSGNSQGAPLLKIGCDLNCLTTAASTTIAATALAGLNTATNNSVFSLIRRAIPQWRIGTLYDVPTVPVYDKNFLTIFANLPYTYYNGTSQQNAPVVASTTTGFYYNSFNNRLDGLAYAMCSCYTGTLWYPGLVTPIGDITRSNRFAFYNLGASDAFFDSLSYNFIGLYRQESYLTPATFTTGAASLVTPHLWGAERAQGVSASALNQTAQNVLDFLFNVNAIPAKGKLSNFNNNGRNKI